MKILLICNRVPFPPKDGGAIAMFNMAKGISSQGIDLTMFCLNTNKHYVTDDGLSEEFKSFGRLIKVDVNTDVKALPAFLNLFSGKSYNLDRFFQPHVSEKLIELLRNESFDIIQLEGFFMSTYVHIIRKNSSAKIVLRSHNIEFQIWKRMASAAGGLKKWYLNLLAKRMEKAEKDLPQYFDAIIPITSEDEIFYNKHFPLVKTFVSPAGLLLEKFVRSEDTLDADSIFHLGSLDWMPNQEAVKWFIETVMPLVLSVKKNVKFYIAGRAMPEYFRNYESENIKVIGEVDDAIAFMNSKEIMVVPLLSGGGMRVKIIEGMALGKIIISTSVGLEGIPYTNQQDVMLADTPERFAECILWSLDNKDKLEVISDNASALARNHFDNSILISKLLKYYKDHIL